MKSKNSLLPRPGGQNKTPRRPYDSVIKNLPLVFFLLIITGSLPSCSSRISGNLNGGGTADFTLTARLEPRITSLIRSFQQMTGGAQGGAEKPVLDGAAISRSMAAAPGMGAVSLRNTAPAELEGKIELTKIGDFLAVSGGEKRFVTFTESAGQGRVIIGMDLETAPGLIAMLSADAASYLSALMAPAATGEAMSRGEYLSLVASLYGSAIAGEIGAAGISASIEFPGAITYIQGGIASGRRADFNVPLLDLLVLDKPLVWEVRWEK